MIRPLTLVAAISLILLRGVGSRVTRQYTAGRTATHLAGKTVLLVESDFHDARDIKHALQHAGARVLGPYADCSSASKQLSDTRISCAVISLEMPVEFKDDLVRALLAKGIALFLTARSTSAVVSPEFAHLPVARKPFDLRDFVRTISPRSTADA